MKNKREFEIRFGGRHKEMSCLKSLSPHMGGNSEAEMNMIKEKAKTLIYLWFI
jgi:hypothetical protein